jgi:hypothetical protein
MMLDDFDGAPFCGQAITKALDKRLYDEKAIAPCDE